MSESFLQSYGLFIAQLGTFFFFVGLIFVLLLRTVISFKPQVKGRISLSQLDPERQALESDWAAGLFGKSELKRKKKNFKLKEKQKRPVLFVLDFHGDVKASGTRKLAEEVSAVIGLAQKGDQVLLKVESPGGSVAGYGLAASQLQRLKLAGLKLSVTIDQVAASGGYLMAVVADEIWSAPFSVVGSIGVVASMPNFKRLLDDKKVDFEQITAGEYKRTLTLFGENTDQDRAKVQEEVDLIHSQFKEWVAQFRPQLDLAKVATGEWWHGKQALELGLVDHLGTSDQLIETLSNSYRIYTLCWNAPKRQRSLLSRLAAQIAS